MKILEGFRIECSLIRDPIYNYIELPDDLKPIVDHELFQRLRKVTQVPLLDMVYPSAKHTRFEHSLGTMYLFMYTIISLYSNDKITLIKLMKEDDTLRGVYTEEEKIRQLILAAGTIGLLHDIGHSPFSHTLEDAIKNYKYVTRNSALKDYNHEKVSIELIEYMKSEPEIKKLGCFFELAYSVLNKDIDPNSGLKSILRKLIDGEIIDVDKGDYLLRDSFHSGTSYGTYEFLRLWNNLKIVQNPTNDYEVVIKEKSAIEALNLQIARFNMYFNVYKHHIRLITDAILSNIIFIALKNNMKVLPYNENDTIDIKKFLYWTDDTLLFELSKNKSIQTEIESFLKRILLKRAGNIEIKELKNSEEIRLYITSGNNKLTENYNLKYDDILVHIFEMPVFPIFKESIQNEKIILTKNDELISVAKYFNFTLDREQFKDYTYQCHTFIKPQIISDNESLLKILQSEILDNLNENLFS